jgi:hypothetical protein
VVDTRAREARREAREIGENRTLVRAKGSGEVGVIEVHACRCRCAALEMEGAPGRRSGGEW